MQIEAIVIIGFVAAFIAWRAWVSYKKPKGGSVNKPGGGTTKPK